MEYTIDTVKTLNVFRDRIRAYKTAIEQADSLARLHHILEGYGKLLEEWKYASELLVDLDCFLDVLKITRKLFEVNAISKEKFQELIK